MIGTFLQGLPSDRFIAQRQLLKSNLYDGGPTKVVQVRFFSVVAAGELVSEESFMGNSICKRFV